MLLGLQLGLKQGTWGTPHSTTWYVRVETKPRPLKPNKKYHIKWPSQTNFNTYVIELFGGNSKKSWKLPMKKWKTEHQNLHVDGNLKQTLISNLNVDVVLCYEQILFIPILKHPQGTPRFLFTSPLRFVLWFKTTCQISEPYDIDNPLLEKSNRIISLGPIFWSDQLKLTKILAIPIWILKIIVAYRRNKKR